MDQQEAGAELGEVKGKSEVTKQNNLNQKPLAGSVTEPAKEDEDLEPGEIAVGDEPEAADDPDERSVFVKNVDFSVNEECLAEHFKECGSIERQTIRKNA
jgi:RNA recognition motif-containing protein